MVFGVSGTTHHKSELKITDNTAIAGQTAPGDSQVDVGDILSVISLTASVPGGFATGSSPNANGDGQIAAGDTMAVINLMAQ